MRYIPALLLILISEAVAISAGELSSPLEGTVAVIVSSEKPTPEPVLQAMRHEVEMLVSAVESSLPKGWTVGSWIHFS